MDAPYREIQSSMERRSKKLYDQGELASDAFQDQEKEEYSFRMIQKYGKHLERLMSHERPAFPSISATVVPYW